MQVARCHAQCIRDSIVGRQSAFPDDFVSADPIVWTQPWPGNKMVFRLPLAHIPSCFTENRHSRGDVDPVDLGQVGPGHAK